MANKDRRDAPEMRRRPDKIGRRYQFTKEDLDKALQAKRESGRTGGQPFHKDYEAKRAAKAAGASEAATALRAELAVVDQHGDSIQQPHAPSDADELYPQCLAALEDGLQSDNWRERFECSKLLLAYFWGRPTQQVVSDKQVRVLFDSPALQHLSGQTDTRAD